MAVLNKPVELAAGVPTDDLGEKGGLRGAEEDGKPVKKTPRKGLHKSKT